MDDCYMKLGAVKAKEIDGELYISCWNFSKALGEKEREISDLCKEIDNLEKQISELESKLETSKHLFDIKHSLKEFSGKNPTEYKKELCKTYTLEEMAGVVVDLEKQLNEMQEIANEYGDKCSKLESELSFKEDLLKIKNGLCEEEPLPFSDEQYEEDLIEELEDRHQQDCITINQLHTTIDTLVDRYAKLREMRGL